MTRAIPMPLLVSSPRPPLGEAMLRTADELRAGDIVELFAGTPVLVLSAHPDPDEHGHRRIVVLDADRDWTQQSVPGDTWYFLRSRGALGRGSDRVAQLRALAAKR